MSIVVVGSVAFDSVKTPLGERERILGGAATYFSVAASFFTSVRVVAVVGDDFGPAEEAVFREREIDITDLERVPGRSFHWSGEYGYDLNVARTRDTQLNVFADFKPKLSDGARETPYLFLGNIQPALQLEVREQVAAKLVAADTMNYWIDNTPDDLRAMLERIDVLVINDAEAREIGKEPNLVRAARRILSMGPSRLVVKRGEYGVVMFSKDSYFATPAYPLEQVFDPTGAGDSFAGGFIGYLIVNSDDVSALPASSELAREMCQRNYGAGADGLIFVAPATEGDADFASRIFNADGSEAGVSGNGTRCVAAFLYHAGLWDEPEIRIATAAGVKHGRLISRECARFEFEFDMGRPDLSSRAVPTAIAPPLERVVRYPLQARQEIFEITCMSMGNPQCVTFISDLNSLNLEQNGPLIETHPIFPDRANVEFARVISRDEIEIRIWERVAWRTLSSGT